MNKKRLLKLADLLEADAKNKKGIRFDIDILACVLPKLDQVGDFVEVKEMKVDCGTSACALGLAAITGAFKRAGLGYAMRGNHIDTTIDGRRVPWDAVARTIFGVDTNTAGWLFTCSGYDDLPTGAKGERIVAKRIRRLVAGKETAPQPQEEEVSF